MFTEETLLEICLALNSMCEGAESRFFNGHTNIVDDRFLCFGVKDVLDTNKSLKDALLFSIPTHQFLFNAGQTDPQEYIRTLQMEEAEFDLIKSPERGVCLYRCGNERYLYNVEFPEFKKAMFGDGDGK